MENTMIKDVKNRKVWGMFVLTMISSMLLMGCHTTKESDEIEKDSPTPTESISEEPDSKVLIVTGEYIPYVGQSLLDRGFVTKIIEATLNNCDIEYKIEFYPWARCTEMVKSGEAWASYPFGHSELNDQTYLSSDNIYYSKHKFFYLKENKDITQEVLDFNKISEFNNFTFGGANGYWYGNPKDFKAVGVSAEWASDTDALLKMLYAERIDFLIEDELVCNEAIRRLFPGEEDKFETLPKDAKSLEYYLIVSKDYPKSQELLDRFNDSLKEIQDSEKSGD